MENSKRKSSTNVLNEEINYVELIDIGRKLVNGEDIKLGQHFITLALLSPNIDLHSKIQASAIKSYAHFKLKDERVTLAQVEKIFRFLKKNRLETLEASLILCIIRVLYRGGSLLIELKKKYTAAYLLYEAKRLFELRQMRDERESSLTTLEDTLKPLLKDITADVSTVKDNYVITEIKTDGLMEKLIKIKNFFTKCEESTQDCTPQEDAKEETPKDDEIFYLISGVWVSNLVTFVEKFEKYSKTEKFLDHIDKVFNRNYILNLYFSVDGNYEYSHYGIYPCEVNNFNIMDFKDSWIDPHPDEQHSNIYLKKGIKEGEDFFYVNQKEWNLINETFGCNYEIYRKTANISYDRLIEVYLKKVKKK
jgi:hypothetical protein